MNDIEKVLEGSIIEGLLFSSYGKFGPTPIYNWPKVVNEAEARASKNENLPNITLRDYIQMSIKNLSLLVGDQMVTAEEDLKQHQYFAILPYPDYKLTAFTFFHYVKTKISDQPKPTAFSILVKENQRSFLYNNNQRLKTLILDFLEELDSQLADVTEFPKIEVLQPYFYNFLMKLIEIEQTPYAPIGSQRKMKIIFAGLDDSGKTSFLLAVARKFSKLIGLKPTRGVNVKSIEALGATIFLWDLGGQVALREKYLNKSQIYLYEADLIFYFIDIKNKDRIEESIEYLSQINEKLMGFNQKTPITYVFSKGDPDIIESEEIKENIQYIKNRLHTITAIEEQEVYITSIFSIFSILRAFSSGISKLSPNKDLIDHNLKNFSEQNGVYLTLLLNFDGLVLADYYSKKSISLTELSDLDDSDDIRSIFEITAPQFAMLYKIFAKFRSLEQNEAIFKVANSVILLKRTIVNDINIFILFLIDDEEKKKDIEESLPDFLERTGNLIIRYIS